jgi:hypothetical protein
MNAPFDSPARVASGGRVSDNTRPLRFFYRTSQNMRTSNAGFSPERLNSPRDGMTARDQRAHGGITAAIPTSRRKACAIPPMAKPTQIIPIAIA